MSKIYRLVKSVIVAWLLSIFVTLGVLSQAFVPLLMFPVFFASWIGLTAFIYHRKKVWSWGKKHYASHG